MKIGYGVQGVGCGVLVLPCTPSTLKILSVTTQEVLADFQSGNPAPHTLFFGDQS
jgi:hypothetical protein